MHRQGTESHWEVISLARRFVNLLWFQQQTLNNLLKSQVGALSKGVNVTGYHILNFSQRSKTLKSIKSP